MCSTAGGARYNFSGIQCVGPADVGDSLFAIEKAVFTDGAITLPGLVKRLKKNLNGTKEGERLGVYLRNLPKFGNDNDEVDRWTVYIIEAFTKALRDSLNSRGGRYVPGLYSVTSHQYFGEVTGALPSGRRRNEPLASGIAPSNGMDRHGPTALINSVNRIDFTEIANGINLNMKFNAETLKKESGKDILGSIIKTYFDEGGMQVQTNVIDQEQLRRAKEDPGACPHLLVRVSGYSAYFHDLSPAMQDEIIARTCVA
jgi:formate C-acetyltransferase